MEEIVEHIEKTKDERQRHLDLNSQCVERGGSSKEFRGLLAHYLDTSIPTKKEAILCHACSNDKCSNPKHLYWGTYSENALDWIETTGKNPYDYAVEKNGIDAVRKRMAEIGSKGGKAHRNKITRV